MRLLGVFSRGNWENRRVLFQVRRSDGGRVGLLL
jgi:hypothetical protein